MDSTIRELKKRMTRSTMTIVTVLLLVFLAAINTANYMLMIREQQSSLKRIMQSGMTVGGGPSDAEDSRSTGNYFTVRVAPTGGILDRNLKRVPDLSEKEAVALVRKVKADFVPDIETESGTEAAYMGTADAGTADAGAADAGTADAGEACAGITDTGTADAGEACAGITDTGTADAGEDASLPSAEEAASVQGKDGNSGPVPSDFRGKAGPGDFTEGKSQSGKIDGYLYEVREEPGGSFLYVFLDIQTQILSCLRVLLVTILFGAAAWAAVLFITIRSSRRAVEPVAENMRRQREFITNAGHEIKTPLAVIVANVDVQQLHSGPSKWLDNIRSQALRLSELTRQMLTLSKMEEGTGNFLVPENFDAAAVLNETLRVFREPAQLRGIKIRTNVDEDVPVRLPKEPFTQVLELLFDNAVKYGREDGTIRVSLKSEKKNIRIRAANDCETLPDVPPQKLFERFYRAEKSRSRQSGGSGIGLSVVAATAQQLGGKACAKYIGSNEIEFEVLLPKNYGKRG